MTEFPEITFLYTAQLRGALELLPRLYTFLKILRGEFHPVYLLDLGDSCAPEVWHCNATDGRSTLIALDGMGYTAAAAGDLSPESRAKLVDQIALTLVDAIYTHATDDGHLQIIMTPAAHTRLEGDRLYLQTVSTGESGGVGLVRLRIQPESSPQLLTAEVRLMPPGTAPDPTIAGVVDFVTGEARYYQKRRTGSSDL